MAVGVIALFVVGALVATRVPLLEESVNAVLDHARVGNLALVVTLALVNGVAEELFFRGALYAAVRRHPMAVTTLVHALTTIATGSVGLVLAAVARWWAWAALSPRRRDRLTRMRSVIFEEHGGAEVLQVREAEDPTPGPGEVVVEVARAGVNFIDTYYREGLYPGDLPATAGNEGAGRVAAVGEGVTDVAVGDRVAWCLVNGQGYTTHAVVPADKLVPVPEGLGDDQAVAALVQGITAHFLARDVWSLESGDTALVHAVAGGVGLLLTQILALDGVTVIGTCSTDAKAEAGRRAGAAHIVRYDREDVAERVAEITGGAGVKVAFDGVGASTFDASLASLAPRGLLCLFGAASGPVPPVDPQRLNQAGSAYLTRPGMATYVAAREELLRHARAVFTLVADGDLELTVGEVYPLSEAARAQEDLTGRRSSGKLLLDPSA
ncbi:zinc-binding dehydrogenase [Kytococcus sp. Marseille-QA3725]